MSFQPIVTGKVSCKDFKATFLGGCKRSLSCKKNGYMCITNTDLCTGVRMPKRPKPTPGPPKKNG